MMLAHCLGVRCTEIIHPLHPNISKHFLHTVLCLIPKELTRRICLTIELFWLVIISFILMTLMFDSEVIL